MLKYSWRREDRDEFLSLPKITSKVVKKKQSSTQVERHIASLKYNISKTNQNLDTLDKKIEEKTDMFKAVNHNLNVSKKSLLLKEEQIRLKKEEVVKQKIHKTLSLFKAYVAQKKAKEIGQVREKLMQKGSQFVHF